MYPICQPPIRLFKYLGFYTYLHSMAELKHSWVIQWSVVHLLCILFLSPLLLTLSFCKINFLRSLSNLLLSNKYEGIDNFHCPLRFFMTPLVMKQFLKRLQRRPPHSQELLYHFQYCNSGLLLFFAVKFFYSTFKPKVDSRKQSNSMHIFV